jgi:nucleoside-diphosphate-sugar epimerase
MMVQDSSPDVSLRARGILVTGGLGWLGSRLVECLVNGIPDSPGFGRPLAPSTRIRCLVLPGQPVPEKLGALPGVEWITGDIRNKSDCERLVEGQEGAVLFHTAGIIHPKRVSDFYSINLEGTRTLLRAAEAAKVRRAIVVSSNSPAGCNPHPDHLFDERSPYNPYMHYGRSKMRMELAVRDIQGEGRIETVVIRAPWFYGPNQPARQSFFFRMIRDGKVPVVGNGENLRSMAYVDNLCQGLFRAAAVAAANGKTYWIADARPYSMNEIVDTVERLLEQDFGEKCARKRVRLPGVVSDVAQWTDASLQALGLYQQKIHVLSEMNKTIACSIQAARADLGYEPAVALEEGMRRSLRWVIQAYGRLG